MRGLKLFLDDIRPAPPGWAVFRTAEELLAYIFDTLGGNLEQVEAMSLDHDLGEGVMSGYGFLSRLEEAAHDGKVKGLCGVSISVHSANPIGRANMMRVLEAIKRHLC